jgi:hypothetical protein
MGAPMMAYGGPMQYKKGGIYIKPSKRGSFTAWAKRHDMGVQEAARHVMANKEDYSSAIVKKANFAKNAAGWKHAMGGKMMYQNAGFLPEDGVEFTSNYTPETLNLAYNFEGPTPATTGGAAQKMMEEYFANPFPMQKVPFTPSGLAPLPMPKTSTGIPADYRPNIPVIYGPFDNPDYESKQEKPKPEEATVKPYKSSLAPYIAGGIGSAVGPIANMIAASAIPDATYTAPAKMQRLGYTPVALARQQANQAIASTREGMRMGAPTQGSYLSNLAVSLPTTAAQTGQLLAKTRYGIDTANVEIANQEALNRQAVAQQNALLKDQSIAQRWNLGLAGAEGIGKGIQGLTSDLTKRDREKDML